MDYVKVSAAGRLAAAEELFAQLTDGARDLCVQRPGSPEWAFYDGERVVGVEAAALRAEQHIGFVLRTVRSA